MKGDTTMNTAQGELRIYSADESAAPDGWTRMQPENGWLIVGHSETGHHHVLDPQKVEVFVSPPNSIGMSVLRVIVRDPTALTHLRVDRPHAPVDLAPGAYDIIPDRQYDYLSEMVVRSQD